MSKGQLSKWVAVPYYPGATEVTHVRVSWPICLKVSSSFITHRGEQGFAWCVYTIGRGGGLDEAPNRSISGSAMSVNAGKRLATIAGRRLLKDALADLI